jgi:K+-transporting ATPase ATPase C chain
MVQQLRIAVLALGLMTLLTGVLYPLLVLVLAQAVFPQQANGSLITKGTQVVGSELIGQPFARPEYFWGRFSATAPVAYNAAASGGSNFGPMHPDLAKNAKSRIDELRQHDPAIDSVPIDLVTASASGLDPHISIAAAMVQIKRVAKARQRSEEEIRKLVEQHTQERQLGVLGEPCVHVLRLNLALDALTQAATKE